MDHIEETEVCQFSHWIRGCCWLVLLPLVALAGCGSGAGISVPGRLMFQGAATAGEMSFEPLDANGKPNGRAVTVNADRDGRFTALLPATGDAESRYRIVLRVSPPSDDQMPTAFRTTGDSIKTVTLDRLLADGKPLSLLVTQ